jgi:type IV pilus assembly protein PilO
MPDLKRTRNRLKIAIGALVVIDAVAIAMLMTPLAGMRQARQQELHELWQQLKVREYAPWRGLDRKIPKAKEQISEFYQQRFPAEESSISDSLGRLAAENGVRITGEKYQVKDAPIEGLQPVEIAVSSSGDYLQLVRFINALERNKLFFLVSGVELGNEQNGEVALQIKIQTFLRST